MRLIAILCWYDEDPLMLQRCVSSLAIANVDHVVAVDGAYAAFPDGQPHSAPAEALAIQTAAAKADISVSIHVPPQLWADNEIEKRTFAFAQAELIAQPGDWYYIHDADHQVMEAPNLKGKLAGCVRGAAEVTLAQQGHSHGFRCLYRAKPGIHLQHNHYTYMLPNGTCLWNGPHGNHIPAPFFPDVVVAHHTTVTPSKRIYWDQRKETMV